ncbi:MAG: exo-alpha-sialidase [Pirellulaceae bacterium]
MILRISVFLATALLALAPLQRATAQRPQLLGVEQIVAHRGASVERPECTLAAVLRAIETGATAVEVDVRTTKDGALVILHDAALDRTTNGEGAIGEITFDELRKLDAGSWFDEKYAQERVPTLAEVLRACKGRIDVLLDLKEQGDVYNAAVVAEVIRHGDPRGIAVGVRSVEQAREFRRRLPQSRQLGLIGSPQEIEAYAEAGVETIRLWPKWLTDEALIPRVRKAGAKLHLNGTSGLPDEVEPLVAHRPESLSSDDPARLMQTLAELQSAEDGEHDEVQVIFSGVTPNKLACDTTLREMPDGSWVMVMLGGGDREPLPANRIFLTRSTDRGKTWSEMAPIDFGVKAKDPSAALVPSELTVLDGRCTLWLATHDGKFGDWKTWRTTSTDSCRTWSPLAPAPGRIADRTFVRNHIVTHDGRLVLPFQHYESGPGPVNPRNGVILSDDGGKTWSVHGDIRLSQRDDYRGWAEPNIVELEDDHLAMILRADRLGGVLYRSDSHDGGRTWSEAARTDIPNPGSKATLYGLGGKTVALLHNPNPKARNPLALWISFDGMMTWPYRRTLVDWPGRLNYPDGYVTPDGEYLNFAFDDNRHRAVVVRAKLPPMSNE